MQEIIREYYELYDNKLDSLKETDTFLGTYTWQEETDNLKRSNTRSEIEFVNKKQNKQNSQQPNSRTRWLPRGTLPNIECRNNTYLSKAI